MNPFRLLLRSAGSHPPVGTWILSASPLLAEAIGHAGFDWAVLDMEHAPADVGEVLLMLQALSASRLVPVVRVPWNEPVAVKRVLDAGAATVLFPLVQNADEAARAVAATRYPPEGIRGVAALSRASRFGTAPQYLRHANDQVGVIVQLETPAALQALDAIAAVPGVDALFVGPAELAAGLGYIGEPSHPEVLQHMARAAERARTLGVPIGTIGPTPEQVAQFRALGFNFVAVGSDLGFLMRGAQAAVGALRTQEGGVRVHTLSDGTHEAG